MSAELKGATSEGTRRLMDEAVAAGRHESAYQPLGRTGLWVSGLGFGGYRVRDGEDDHRHALAQALARGCNLVDTSTNYGDGASERLVGSVLPAEMDRDSVVVVTKAGYVQGTVLRAVRQQEAAGAGYPEMVRLSEHCWHCIHPEFLADQLERSLDRLGLDRIDVLMLHNPEYFLVDRARNGGRLPIEQRRDVFYGRMKRAFEWLEAEVEKGRIGWYGVSSNTFVVPADRPDATSLATLVDLARSVGGESHHFAAIQLPLNLVERGAVSVRDGDETVLELAAREGIGVLVNRPLNALSGGRVLRLADFRFEPGIRVERLVRAVDRLEDEFAEGLGRTFDFADDDGTEPFRYAEQLRQQADKMSDVVAWDEYVELHFGPEVSSMVNRIDDALHGPIKMPWKYWLERYVEAVGALLEGLRGVCARQSQRRSDRIGRSVGTLVPQSEAETPLSQRAVAIVRGLHGVTTVLVGMRQPRYVADVMQVLDRHRFTVAAEELAGVELAGVDWADRVSDTGRTNQDQTAELSSRAER